MEFTLTQHARDVLKAREIHQEWVETIIQAPEKIEEDSADPELEHRLGKIKEYGNRCLRVVINRKAKPVRVVRQKNEG